MKYPTPYLKMQVLGAIENAEGKTRRDRIKNVAKLIFTDEYGNKRQFTWRTISTWYCRYQKHGITGIEPKVRKDKGTTRKASPEEVLEAINEARRYFKSDAKPCKTAIYRMCISKKLLREEQIARTTFLRTVDKFDLLDKKGSKSPRRLAFAMQYANDLWQVDTCFGPYVDHKERKVQSKLIAFIDDASRVICHGQFFPSENVDALMEALKNALYKRGIPKQIYADNGSIYCSSELNLVCARIGATLRHAPVRDSPAKGKVERFFRTVRGQFLERNLDLSSFERLNKQFSEWVEGEYNSRVHSIIKMAPIDRFAIDRKMITYLPPCETNDELFYNEATRKVAKDNTFRFENVRYETPVELANKTIDIRYPRHSSERRVIVYYKGDRLGEAKVLDLVSNSKIKRKRKEASK